MKRYVLRDEITGKYFKAFPGCFADSPVDALVFDENDIVNRIHARYVRHFEIQYHKWHELKLYSVDFSVNSCEKVVEP